MATQEQKLELQDKVGKVVTDRFAGDYQKAFQHYDRQNKDAKINKAELVELLKDAGIGTWITRAIWADGIIAELDTDQDGVISAAEFQAVLR